MSYLKSKEEIKNFLKKNNCRDFHLKQIEEWIYKKNISSFEEMTNLSKDLRDKLNKNFNLYSLKLKKCQLSKDKQTKKYLFQLEDGYLIETVLILSNNRRTVCLSTQVGCSIKCSFCASGQKGFFRNLKSYEIIEQIIHVANDMKDKPTHIVFMGMGEPLLNLKEVLRSITIISSNEGFNISQRKITISTVGILENIKKLKEKSLKINLALSLHAPNDEVRNKIIPFSRKYKLKDLIKEVKLYFKETKRDISFEYILIEDINDSLDHAKQLSFLLKNIQCSINLIPYNPVKGLNYKKPDKDKIKKFKSYLLKNNFVVTQRYTKGDDISAACGQLAL
jgi:23S rRNA (adenine2503-C2)-methyltransferase